MRLLRGQHDNSRGGAGWRQGLLHPMWHGKPRGRSHLRIVPPADVGSPRGASRLPALPTSTSRRPRVPSQIPHRPHRGDAQPIPQALGTFHCHRLVLPIWGLGSLRLLQRLRTYQLAGILGVIRRLGMGGYRGSSVPALPHRQGASVGLLQPRNDTLVFSACDLPSPIRPQLDRALHPAAN